MDMLTFVSCCNTLFLYILFSLPAFNLFIAMNRRSEHFVTVKQCLVHGLCAVVHKTVRIAIGFIRLLSLGKLELSLFIQLLFIYHSISCSCCAFRSTTVEFN